MVVGKLVANGVGETCTSRRSNRKLGFSTGVVRYIEKRSTYWGVQTRLGLPYVREGEGVQQSRRNGEDYMGRVLEDCVLRTYVRL